MRNKHMWVTTSIALGLAITTSASAIDTKSFPGAMCSRVGETQSDNFTRGNGGNMTFTGDPGGWGIGGAVSCPVVRDDQNNLNGLFQAAVRVYDPSNATLVQCTFYSYDPNSGAVDWETKSTTQGATGNTSLTFQAIDNSAAPEGYYHMVCLLPQNGRVNSYAILEWDEE